jgi:hypothetical protein
MLLAKFTELCEYRRFFRGRGGYVMTPSRLFVIVGCLINWNIFEMKQLLPR